MRRKFVTLDVFNNLRKRRVAIQATNRNQRAEPEASTV
jgi:hypothetical protein